MVQYAYFVIGTNQEHNDLYAGHLSTMFSRYSLNICENLDTAEKFFRNRMSVIFSSTELTDLDKLREFLSFIPKEYTRNLIIINKAIDGNDVSDFGFKLVKTWPGQKVKTIHDPFNEAGIELPPELKRRWATKK